MPFGSKARAASAAKPADFNWNSVHEGSASYSNVPCDIKCEDIHEDDHVVLRGAKRDENRVCTACTNGLDFFS